MPDTVHFLMAGLVDLPTPDTVRAGPFPHAASGRGATLDDDADLITAVAESMEVTDARRRGI